MRLDPRALLAGAFAVWLVTSAPLRAEPPPLPGPSAPSESTGTGASPDAGSEAGRESGISSPSTSVPFGREPSSVLPGTIAFPFDAVAPPPGLPGRGWSVVPSIALQLLGTDNLDVSRRDRRSEFIASVIPGLLLNVDTARVQGIVNYTPMIQFYASDSEQNRVDHRGNGQVLFTVVPDSLFLDVRGAAGVQSARSGLSTQGSGVVGTPIVDRDNRVQTMSFQISPYVVHRFGDVATVQAGYAFQSVTQDLGGGASGAFTPTGQRFFSDQDFTAHEFYAVGRTGEYFGRLAMEARLTSTSYDGTGVLDGAYRRLGVLEARYAFNRAIIGLVEGGYEQQRYRGVPGIEINEPVWALGGRINFSPESWITAKYGHRDGFNSLALDGAVSLGVRTRATVNYSERLTTGAQRAADLLATTTLDERGNPVDTATGAPVQQSFTNSFLGVQGNLSRVRRLTAAISQSWPRDTVMLSISREERRPVSVEVGTVAVQQRGTSGSLSWSHELTPSTTAITTVGYGRFDSGVLGRGDVFNAGLTVVTQFAPGLTGFAQYGFLSRGDDGASGRASQHLGVVGLRQSF